MKAIILAAGAGTRLGKYTRDLPKCMLGFAGKSLLQRQVDTLRACGVTDIIIIKGYMQQKINIAGVKYYVNEHHASTNMVETLFAARAELAGDVLVCYADIIYEEAVLKKVLASDFDIGVVVDGDYLNYWQARFDSLNTDIESLVVDDAGHIVELGQQECDTSKAKFRYVGIIKFSPRGIDLFKSVYDRNKAKYYAADSPWMSSKSFKTAYMTCMLQATINEGVAVSPITIRRGWLEFDTVSDYERATTWLKSKTINRFIKLEA